jgi:uncharacterized membrane protein
VYCRGVKASTLSAVVTLIALSFPVVALCGPTRAEGRRAKEQTEEVLVFVTGSLIPQRVRVSAIGTPTTSPLRVIDRREIDQTGRFTTPDAFVNDPSVRIIGH